MVTAVRSVRAWMDHVETTNVETVSVGMDHVETTSVETVSAWMDHVETTSVETTSVETTSVEAVRAWIETLSRNQRPMRNLLLALVLSLAVASCSRPSSYEPFVVREKAEYGDTYIFNLDLSDSTVSYGLDFYTRLERPAFGEFPADSISLDLRWISPSDSVILSDTTFIRVDAPVDSSYYSRDFVSGYKAALNLPEHGQWRLKAKVLNDSEAIRGLGVVFTRKENGTR